MSIYEYNEEYVKKVLYEDGEAAGSYKMLVRLVESFMSAQSIDPARACKEIGISLSEYESAKEFLSKA